MQLGENAKSVQREWAAVRLCLITITVIFPQHHQLTRVSPRYPSIPAPDPGYIHPFLSHSSKTISQLFTLSLQSSITIIPPHIRGYRKCTPSGLVAFSQAPPKHSVSLVTAPDTLHTTPAHLLEYTLVLWRHPTAVSYDVLPGRAWFFIAHSFRSRSLLLTLPPKLSPLAFSLNSFVGAAPSLPSTPHPLPTRSAHSRFRRLRRGLLHGRPGQGRAAYHA